ncbi:MAG: hypothetical protein BWY76_01137 [bacterium ADurb.Bin429]|nr:MAG: hypothetical protein BWY76_01137 [bacterium ADurb.Bin429]
MRFQGFAVVILMLLALCITSGAVSATEDITVQINGTELDRGHTWRNQDGRITGPITPIIQALGATAKWDQQTKTLSITVTNPWGSLEPYATNWQVIPPYSFDALGPILTVRHHLAKIQYSSLMQPSTLETNPPVLARFEVIKAIPMNLPSDALFTTELRGGTGFLINAVLYWVTLDPKRPVQHSGTGVVRVESPDGDGYGRYGPIPQQVRIETIQYQVVPEDATLITPPDPPHLQVQGVTGTQAVIWGQKGWQVKTQTTLQTNTYTIKPENTVVPLFDVSVQHLSPLERRMGYQPFAFPMPE